MLQPDIRILVDHQQKRLWQGRQSRITLGKDCIDAKYWSNVYAEPITGTVFLRPQVYEDAWQTSSTGRFARLTKSQFIFENANAFVEHNVRFNGDIYLHSLGTQNQVVKTLLTYEKNRGFFVSFFQYNITQEVSLIFECGWGDGPGASDIWLQFFSDGLVGVILNNDTSAFAATGTISGRDESGGKDSTPAMQPQRYWECLLLPCRKRELLVSSNQGGGFRFITDDESDDPEDQDVADIVNPGLLYDSHVTFNEHKVYNSARRFWFRVPNAQATVQVVPLNFPTTGYIVGPEHQWTYVPNQEETPDFTIWADPPGYGAPTITASAVLPDDPNTPYTPDPDGENKFKVRINFGGDGIATYFFNACEIAYRPIFGLTEEPADGAFDITQYVTRLSLSVPDDEAGVEAEIEYRQPDAIEEHYPMFRSMGNRPIKIMLGDNLLLDGFSECPSWSEGISDEARHGTIKVRDRWKAFEYALVVDPCPLDMKPAVGGAASEARTLEEVFQFLFTFGDPSADLLEFDIDHDLANTKLPRSPSPSKGEFSVQMEVGDSWASWLTRIKENFCPLHKIGIRPGENERSIGYVKRKTEDDAQPYYDLWPTIDEAIDSFKAAGYSDADARHLAPIKGTYRKSDQSTLEPEANVVYVTGEDKRDGKPIQAFVFNSSSLDPTVAPQDREDDWLGEERLYGWIDQTLSSKKSVKRGAELLSLRLFPRRDLVQHESGFLFGSDLVPLWRGFPIELRGIGMTEIASFQCDFVKSVRPADNEDGAENNEDDWEWQDATYCSEIIVPDAIPV